MGGFTFSTADHYSIGLGNSNSNDAYVVSTSSVVMSDNTTPEYWEAMRLFLNDSTSMAISNINLTQQISLEDWDHASLTMFPFVGGLVVSGEITHFEYVPEPVSIAFLLIGGMAVIRRR